MDKNLFSKYTQQIKKQSNKKQEILSYIKEKTGIEIFETEIEIKKTIISFYISSSKKNTLHQKKIQEILKEKGYTLK